MKVDVNNPENWRCTYRVHLDGKPISDTFDNPKRAAEYLTLAPDGAIIERTYKLKKPDGGWQKHKSPPQHIMELAR